MTPVISVIRSVPVAPVRQDRSASPHVWEDAQLDGLFTYCLSVLRDHDAAVTALGAALAVAERRRGRAPRDVAERRAWLYALARWACLARLAATRRARTAPPAVTGTPSDGGAGPHTGTVSQDTRGTLCGLATRAAARCFRDERRAEPADPPRDARRHGRPDDEPYAFDERRKLCERELALLVWPEATGTAPEQREALELTVRHGLTASEVAAVLGMRGAGAARELIAAAACEVERVQAAVFAVRTGGCPAMAWLGGDPHLLGALLCRRLVRHVDDCPRCRRAAERADARTWPGTSLMHTALPLVVAPRTGLRHATAAAPRTRAGGPRFDRRGYPVLRRP